MQALFPIVIGKQILKLLTQNNKFKNHLFNLEQRVFHLPKVSILPNWNTLVSKITVGCQAIARLIC